MTTTVTEIQQIQPSTRSYIVRSTPKWIEKTFFERNIWERLATIDLASKKCYKTQPQKSSVPPVHSTWFERLWLLCMISPPLIIQSLWYHFVPEDNYYHTWHPLISFAFYVLAFIIFTIVLVKHIHYYMNLYGTFNEHQRPRDYVPDKMVKRVVAEVLIYFLVRTGIGFILGGYDRTRPPSLGGTISWLFIIKVGLWLIILDLFFYCYHRTCHTVPFLWNIHSLHHFTKSPTPLLSILSGDIQDIIEVILIPTAASFILTLTTHEFWIAQCILLYVEAMGHSGIRAYWPHPLLNEVLQPFQMVLCIEDHELHHRFGKSGMNYGKQTRIFDRIFGTVSERIECTQR